MQPERFEETVRRARARWEGSAPWAAAPPERPRVVWSGDGGSVGLGGVMLNRATVERARHRDFEGAAAEFLRFNKLGIPRRLMRKGLADALAALPRKGVRDELEVLECADPGRAPHLFLMLHNETRRYAERYEDIDLHRTEFQVPFLDTDFLEAVFAAPIDRLLGHEQYMEWLACFPREVTAVPWQAYPGHAACPLPVAAEMRYQWGPRFYDAATEAALKRTIQRQADAALRARDFPQSIIDRRRLRIAAWLTRLGVRDYGYAIECAATYCRYWQGCDGRCDDPLLKH